MTRHGALEPDPASDEPVASPSRPPAIELATAILVVGGVIGLFAALVGGASAGPSASDPFLLLTLALNAGSVVVGVLVRLGRVWILAVNYVAVLGFLDLLAAGESPLALMLGLAEIVVVVLLFLNKPWFDAMARWRATRPTAGSRLSP